MALDFFVLWSCFMVLIGVRHCCDRIDRAYHKSGILAFK